MQFRVRPMFRVPVLALGMSLTFLAHAQHPRAASVATGTEAVEAHDNAGADDRRVAQDASPHRSARTASRERATEPQSAAFGRDFRVTRLLGMRVHNLRGEDIGVLKDLVLDLNNGRVHYAILSFGGFLGLGGYMGIGDKRFVFPVTRFRMGRDWNELVLDVDETKLAQAPGFDDAAWPDWGSADYHTSIEHFFGNEVQPAARGGRFVRASEVLEADLQTESGDDVGDVQDIVVSLENGKIRFAVVEFDPGWLQVERQVALPMKAFAPQRAGHDLVITVDRERLRDAPVFDPVTWRGYDPAYYGTIDRYSTGMGWGPVYPYDEGLGRYGYGYGGFAYPPGYGERFRGHPAEVGTAAGTRPDPAASESRPSASGAQ